MSFPEGFYRKFVTDSSIDSAPDNYIRKWTKHIE